MAAATGRYRDAVTGRFVSPRNLPWPPNGGYGTSTQEAIAKGTVLDRFGAPSGRYLAEPGTTISQRGMAPGSELLPYHRYIVRKPFDAKVGPALPVPEFGAEGGARQFREWTGKTIQWLLDNNFIEVLR